MPAEVSRSTAHREEVQSLGTTITISLYRILLSGLIFHFCSVYDTNRIWYLVYKMVCFEDRSHIQALLFPAYGVSLTLCWCDCLFKLESTKVGCLIKLCRALTMVHDSLTLFFWEGGGLCTSSYCLTEHGVLEASCASFFRQGKHIICQTLYSPVPKYSCA